MAQVILAVLGISLLMIVHEAGHYLMARATGMRVLTFSIGFGPALFRYRPRGSATVFQLCVVPLLAYVRVAGASELEPGFDPKDPALCANKGIAARALMFLGGPVANYVFASLVVFGLALAGWREEVPMQPMTVGSVEPGSAADAAGVRSGDVIREVEGAPVADVASLAKLTAPRAGMTTSYLIERAGATQRLTVVPRDRAGRGVLGVTAKSEHRVRDVTVGEAATMAVVLPWKLTVQNAEGIADLIRHRTTAGMTGPVGMTKIVAAEAKKDAYSLASVLLAISVGLGFFNLLPFPFLDGGRLLFLGYEALAGRRPSANVEAIVHAAGMLLLLGMAAFVTWRDVMG